jgi:hypothetical protein
VRRAGQAAGRALLALLLRRQGLRPAATARTWSPPGCAGADWLLPPLACPLPPPCRPEAGRAGRGAGARRLPAAALAAAAGAAARAGRRPPRHLPALPRQAARHPGGGRRRAAAAPPGRAGGAGGAGGRGGDGASRGGGRHLLPRQAGSHRGGGAGGAAGVWCVGRMRLPGEALHSSSACARAARCLPCRLPSSHMPPAGRTRR